MMPDIEPGGTPETHHLRCLFNKARQQEAFIMVETALSLSVGFEQTNNAS